jgi:regulator of RNase E activity RraA
VSVFPGDALVGDDDGVVVIPRHLVVDVAARAIEQERRERFILARISAGASIIGTYPPDADTIAAYEATRGPD